MTMTIQEWVQDLYDSCYKDSNLTTSEIVSLVNGSDYDKELNYDIQCAIEDYIEEFLWDIGKPTRELKHRMDVLKHDYFDWLVKNHKQQCATAVVEFLSIKGYECGCKNWYLICSILRGRECGELRSERGC